MKTQAGFNIFSVFPNVSGKKEIVFYLSAQLAIAPFPKPAAQPLATASPSFQREYEGVQLTIAWFVPIL